MDHLRIPWASLLKLKYFTWLTELYALQITFTEFMPHLVSDKEHFAT